MCHAMDLGCELSAASTNERPVHFLRQQVVDLLALLEHHLPANTLGSTLDEDVDKLSLGLAQAIGIGDIPSAACGGTVHTGCATRLEAHTLQNTLEVLTAREQRELDHGTGTKACAEVGRASQDVAEMIVVHEVLALCLEHLANAVAGSGEAHEDALNVVAFLHGDDSHLVLLVHPAEEVASIVVEDTTAVRPVTPASRGQQQGTVGLLKEVTLGAELFFLGLGHAIRLGCIRLRAMQREVVALHLACHLQQARGDHALELTTLLKVARGGKTGATNRAASAAAACKHVLTVATVVASGVNLGRGEVGWVHVGGMLRIGSIAPMASTNDRIEKRLESLVGLLVASDHAHSLNHGVALIVNASLNAFRISNSERGFLVLELTPKRRIRPQHFGHDVVVAREVGHLVRALVSRESGTLLSTDVLGVAAAQLDPLGETLHAGSETERGIVRVGGLVGDGFCGGRGRRRRHDRGHGSVGVHVPMGSHEASGDG